MNLFFPVRRFCSLMFRLGDPDREIIYRRGDRHCTNFEKNHLILDRIFSFFRKGIHFFYPCSGHHRHIFNLLYGWSCCFGVGLGAGLNVLA